ncbi:NEL-type E3 ubiquitin ligase domain-containing protein, partial [Pseudomonas sp. PDM25]|uniref:NEL-type E3 ubiquitin ligase domain-containing protein n=1 Tax=Pseudomonas sp. PDM25 TaxID=2854772 RepID=UPI001C4517E6
DWSSVLSVMSPGLDLDKFKLLQAFFANGPAGVSEEMLRQRDIYRQSRLSGPVIAYVPDDPQHPLKEYASLADFMKTLIRQLREPDYQAFFSRFVAHKDQGRFFARVRERLSRITWQQREPLDMGPWWRETAVENPNAEPVTHRLAGELWPQLYRLKRDKALSDARAIAVPTGDEDAATRWKRLSSYLDIGWNVFNFAAMLVPGLGEAMLALMVAQMAEELLEGIEDWSKGDRDEASAHINGVIINFAQLALMSAGHVIPQAARLPVKPSALIDNLKPVELPTGKTRLWKPDLTPYEHPVALPTEAKPDDLGLYRHNDQQWLRLEQKHYQVRQDPATGEHRLQHPTRSNAYQPAVEHNGAGAWKAETEQPLTWERPTLLRRLGHRVDALSDGELELARKISGTHEGLLRKMYVEREPLPPLLADTLSRFEAYRQTENLVSRMESTEPGVHVTIDHKTELFNTRYASQQVSGDPRVELIKSRFTGVPTNIVEDVLAGASSAERRQMAQWDFANPQQTKPVPLRLAEALRNAQREVRLSRAYEGLYLQVALTADTETLVLHTLEALPSGKKNLRIEVRNGSFNGELRASVGPQDATERKVLVRNEDGRYEARDSDDNHLHGADDLYAALQHALPQNHRAALGLPHVGQGAELKQLIKQHVLSRDGLRKALRMQPIKPFFKAPMRGGDGTFGYPLSGRGQGTNLQMAERRARVRRLYPSLGNADVEMVLAQAERAQAHPTYPLSVEEYLLGLEEEFASLQQEANAWVDSPGTHVLPDGSIEPVSRQDRQRVADLLRRCWQRTNSPQQATGSLYAEGVLSLTGLRIGELPVLTRALFTHVYSLDLSAMALGEITANFLEAFPNLREVSLENNRLQTLPQTLRLMPRLQALYLSRNVISLSPEAIVALEGFPALRQLHLSHNPLGRIPDFRRMPTLRQLNLRNTGLTEWPAGLDALPHLQGIDLRDNLITRVADEILNPAEENAAAARRVFNSAVLDGNPLTPAALEDYAQAWLRIPPPEDGVPIAIEPLAVADPLANSNERLQHWMRDLPAGERAARQEQWSLLEGEDPRSQEFFRLLENLRQTGEYRNAYPDLQARVWALMDAAGESEQLRTELFRLAGDVETCADGAALIFSRLEVKSLISHGLSTQATPELSALAKGLFRLDEVERIAQQDASERIQSISANHALTLEQKVQEILLIDRVEIRLAYRIGLKDRLGLPGQPQQARYIGVADVTATMLDAAEQRVLALDNSPQEFAATTQRDFWRGFLKHKYADEFLLEQAPLHARLEALTATEMASQEYLVKSAELAREFEAVEDAFIKRKTQMELPDLNAGD